MLMVTDFAACGSIYTHVGWLFAMFINSMSFLYPSIKCDYYLIYTEINDVPDGDFIITFMHVKGLFFDSMYL